MGDQAADQRRDAAGLCRQGARGGRGRARAEAASGIRAKLAAAVAALLLSACGLDTQQARICERVIPALEGPESRIAVVAREADPTAAHAVRLRYRTEGRSGEAGEHWISCRFGGGRLERGRTTLVGVVTDREEALSEVDVFMLRRFWLGRLEAQARPVDEAAEGGIGRAPFAYLLQLLVNAVGTGCLYGLLAIAYTLVYALIGRINLAFGELAMIGGYSTVLGVALLAAVGTAALLPGLLAVLLLAMTISAAYGLATQRLVFRPLRGSASQAVLIATIGLSIFLQEYVRLAQGSREPWLQPLIDHVLPVLTVRGFAVTVTTAQLLIPLLTLALYWALARLMGVSAFGRAHRACADDWRMAALCGINVGRTMSLTFALGGAYAAVAGLMIAIGYGTASFHMGFLLGLKALTAAIVGGIGSIPGAMLGGLLIALLEALWSGYADIGYQNIAVFGVLILTLVLRPDGLLGTPEPRLGPAAPGLR